MERLRPVLIDALQRIGAHFWAQGTQILRPKIQRKSGKHKCAQIVWAHISRHFLTWHLSLRLIYLFNNAILGASPSSSFNFGSVCAHAPMRLDKNARFFASGACAQ
eukprot:scaffold16896_cov64-Cylindrotheca_fusiformis.AAC.1